MTLLEALKELKEAYPDEYCVVQVEAGWHSVTTDRNDKVIWKAYTGELDWTKECATFEECLNELREVKRREGDVEIG